MPLAATILACAAIGALWFSMALVYAVNPPLRAYGRRLAPPVEVPEFDIFAPRQINRLVWQVLTIRLPKDRPRLRNLLVATRLVYLAAPLLMVSAMALGLQGAALSPAQDRESGPPPYILEIPAEPAR